MANTPLAKIVGGKIFFAQYGPRVRFGGRVYISPDEQTWRGLGFEELPTSAPPEGWHDEWRIAYDGDGHPYIEAYAAEDPPAPPEPPAPVKVYSKLELINSCKTRGIWDAVKQEIASLGKEDEFIAAQDLRDDYPGFSGMVDYFKGKFTDVDVDAVLEDAEV